MRYPIVVTGDMGVFEIAEEGLVPLIRNRLIHTFVEGGSTIENRPVAIAASDRAIYVATRSLGVFAFLEHPDGYEFSQVTLP